MHFDATSNRYVERASVPLSTYELRQALLLEDANSVVLVEGAKRKPASAKWGDTLRSILIYSSNTYEKRSGKVYTIKDDLGGRNHPFPQNPQDIYFPINQATLSLAPDGPNLKATVRTFTPNFKEFQVRLDGGEWKNCGSSLTWTLHKGANRLEARSLNLFDVAGFVSTVEVDVAE
jgi:hypothetical protein